MVRKTGPYTQSFHYNVLYLFSHYVVCDKITPTNMVGGCLAFLVYLLGCHRMVRLVIATALDYVIGQCFCVLAYTFTITLTCHR